MIFFWIFSPFESFFLFFIDYFSPSYILSISKFYTKQLCSRNKESPIYYRTNMTSNETIGDFKILEVVGQGGFSDVFKCTYRDSTNAKFAIKRLLPTANFSKVQMEIQILKELSVFVISLWSCDPTRKRRGSLIS